MPSEGPRSKALRRIQEALGHDSRPRQLSDARFDQTHELFERSSDQQQRILQWLTDQIHSHPSNFDPLRVFSVGCGSGILDNPLMASLATIAKRIDYTGVDPNGVACRRFRDDFRMLGLPNVRLDLREESIETIQPTDSFDFILAVHSIYYFPDPAATLDFLVKLLGPRGKLVIIQAPKAELNQLADCFWHRPADGAIWFSDQLEEYFSTRSLRFTRQRIDSCVDVARCFEAGCARGEMMLDFITQTDCRHLDDDIVRLCLHYLRLVSRPDKGRRLVAHPVDAFIVEAGANREFAQRAGQKR